MRGGRIVGGGERVGLAVIREGAVFLAELFAVLAQQARQERVALGAGTVHGLGEFGLGAFQVAGVKRDVADEVREITFLLFRHLGIAVEQGASGGDVALSFDWVAAAGGNAAERVGEAIIPEALRVRLGRGFFAAERGALAVPILGGVEIPGVDADARGFVGHFALLIKRQLRFGGLAGRPVGDDFFFEGDGGFALAGEGVRHGKGALGGGLSGGIRRGVDALLENSASGLRLAERVEEIGGSGGGGIGGELALDSGERFSVFTVADAVNGLAKMRRRLFAFALFLLGKKPGGRGDDQQR